MTLIDHTCIYFHNGMLMKEIEHYDWIEHDNSYYTSDGKAYVTNEIAGTTNKVRLLPFYTTRDGLFVEDDNTKFEDMNRIFPDVWFNNRRKEARVIKAWEKHPCKTEDKYPKLDFENRVYWYKDLNKLIISQHTEDYCLTFYFKLDTKDSWVVFGGYGHYNNPYTHFYHRGYGELFEQKMALEAYKWICERLLPDLLDYCISETIEEDEEHIMGTEYTKYYKALADMLRFKNYWSMVNTPEEKEEYFKTALMEYDPESLFPESETIREEPSEEFKRLVDSL